MPSSGSGDSSRIKNSNLLVPYSRYSRPTATRIVVQPIHGQFPGIQPTGNVLYPRDNRKCLSSLKFAKNSVFPDVNVDENTAAQDKNGGEPNGKKGSRLSKPGEDTPGPSSLLSVQSFGKSHRNIELNPADRHGSDNTPILAKYAAGTPSPRVNIDSMNRCGDVVMVDLDQMKDSDTLPASPHKAKGHTDLLKDRNRVPTTGIRHLLSIRNRELMAATVHDGRETASSTETDDTIGLSVSIVFAKDEEVDSGCCAPRITQRMVGQLRKLYCYLKKKITFRKFILCGGRK